MWRAVLRRPGRCRRVSSPSRRRSCPRGQEVWCPRLESNRRHQFWRHAAGVTGRSRSDAIVLHRQGRQPTLCSSVRFGDRRRVVSSAFCRQSAPDLRTRVCSLRTGARNGRDLWPRERCATVVIPALPYYPRKRAGPAGPSYGEAHVGQARRADSRRPARPQAEGRVRTMRPGALVLLVVMLLLAGCTQKTAVAPLTSPVSATGPALGKGEWAAAACGSYHTLAVKQDGTLWTWGLNDYGQLGWDTIDGSAHATPTQVGHARDWASVSAGYGNSFAVRKDGTVWAWGNNCDIGFNLGLGDDNWWFTRWSPTRIGQAHDWATVFYGYFHGLALKNDSTLWGWGLNVYGALGESDGTFVRRPGRGRPRQGLGGRCRRRRLLAGPQTGRHPLGLRRQRLGQPRPGRRDEPTEPDPGRRRPRLGGRLGRHLLQPGLEGGRHAVGLGRQHLRRAGPRRHRRAPQPDPGRQRQRVGGRLLPRPPQRGLEEGRHAVGLGRELLRPARPGRHHRPTHSDTGRQRSRVGGHRTWRRRLLPHPGPQAGRHPLGLGLQPVRSARPGRHERPPQPGTKSAEHASPRGAWWIPT